MKITDIETFRLVTPIEKPFAWSQYWTNIRTVGIVKITTDEGIIGWGEGCEGSAEHIINDVLKPLLIGEDPTNRIGLWEKMFHVLYNRNEVVGFGGSAISAIDIALWDITGKHLNVPIHTLLGGKVRDKIAVYATGLYYTEEEFSNIEILLSEARSYVDAGFLGMKTKIGRLSIEKDVERVKALRDEIGYDLRLMVDANQSYNAASAIRIANKMESLDIMWFEEPVNAQDLEGYLQVKAGVQMAVSGGENLRTRYEFEKFLSNRAYDIAQPDVVNVGGITEMRNIAMTANSMGIQVNPHVWGSPIMIAASLHLTSTFPNCPPSGDPQPFTQQPVMEYDRSPSPLREGISNTEFEMKEGYLSVPSGPGLGVEIDEKALRKLAI
ncbi:MAG: mandelate racemase/muconate lactonizing enzyme family protein [Dehalococcoidia bacterium]